MIDRITNLTAQPLGKPAGPVTGPSFADTLKKQIGEVAQLQQDASQAVDEVTTGQTDDMSGVLVAMAKSDTAFKTLLAIRSKLLDAYDEIKNMPI
jgi:flagellar hook-basal body complex protein FliE